MNDTVSRVLMNIRGLGGRMPDTQSISLLPPATFDSELSTTLFRRYLWILAGVLSFQATVGILFFAANKIAATVTLVLAVVFLVAIPSLLLRAGRAGTAARFAAVCGFILIQAATIVSGGVRSPLIALQIAMTVNTAMILGRRWALAAIFGYLCSDVGIAMFQHAGGKLPIVFPLPPLGVMIVLLLAFLASLPAVVLNTERLRKALADRNELLRELLRAQQMLEQAQTVARCGNFQRDLPEGVTLGSPELFRIMEVPLPPSLPGREWAPRVVDMERFYARFSEKDREAIQVAVKQAEQGTPTTLVCSGPASSGETRHYQFFFQPQHDTSGNAVRLNGAVQDVTERETTRKQLETLIDSIGGVVWEADPNTLQFRFVSGKAESLLGFPREEWIVNPSFWAEHVYPDDIGWTAAFCKQATANYEDHTFDYRMIAANGQVKWLRDIVTVVQESGRAKALRGIMLDISEQKSHELALRDSEARLSLIFDASPDLKIFIRHETDGRFTVESANRALREHIMARFGLNAIDYVGKSLSSAIGSTDQLIESRLAILRQVVRDKCEVHYDSLDGPLGDAFEVTMTPVLDEAGRCSHILASGHRIAERLKAEADLRRSEQRYALVLEATQDGIFDWNLTSDEVFLSKRWKGILGFDDDELPSVAGTVYDRLHPDDLFKLRATPDALNEDPVRMLHKNGAYRWIQFRSRLLYDGAGRAVRMLGSITDITQKRLAEAALQESERRLSLIFNSTSDMQILFRVLDGNRYMPEAINWSFRETMRRSLLSHSENEDENDRTSNPASEGFSADLIGQEQRYFQEAINSREAITYEFHVPHSRLLLEIRVHPVFDLAGRCTHVLWVGRDVTERKRTEVALRVSLNEKETLLKEVHHRVKNNLQIISSLLHFQAKIADPSQDCNVFRDAQDRLRSMILVHEKLYRSHTFSAINFGDYLRSLAQQLANSHQAAHRNIRLDITADETVLPAETALPCGMIVNELLSNAFKYAFPNNRPGNVTLRVNRSKDHLVLSVNDDGVGLAPSPRSNTFGMELVHNLSEQLGGTLKYQSSRGTTVTLDIPYDENVLT